MKINNVITNIDELTPEWLTDTLKNNGHLTQGKVTKIIKRKSRETSASFMHYLQLRFSNGSQVERPIRKIVVRHPNHSPLSRDLGMHETKFYSTVAESMNQMPIPTCYDTAISDDGNSHIILEDLSRSYVEVDSFLPSSKRYFENAIDCLAELHVFWWDHPKLKEFSKPSYTSLNFKENSFNDKDHVILFSNGHTGIERMPIPETYVVIHHSYPPFLDWISQRRSLLALGSDDEKREVFTSCQA